MEPSFHYLDEQVKALGKAELLHHLFLGVNCGLMLSNVI